MKATGARVMIVGHEMDRGTVTYRAAYPTGAEEGGLLVNEQERAE